MCGLRRKMFDQLDLSLAVVMLSAAKHHVEESDACEDYAGTKRDPSLCSE